MVGQITDLHSWHPYRRAELGKDDIAGDLAEDVTDGPAGLHVVQLVLIESEIFLPVLEVSNAIEGMFTQVSNLHPRNESAIDIDLIQIFDEVPYLH
jgi:hypothetical protein